MKAVVLNVLGGVVTALTGALLFGCAARWDLPLFRAYLGVWTALVLVVAFVADPTLARERFRPGPGAKDCLSTVPCLPLGLGQFVVAGLDVGRFHWSDTVPPAVQVVGLLAVAAALAVVMWKVAVNRFFSPVIRIQTDRGAPPDHGRPLPLRVAPRLRRRAVPIPRHGLALGSWLAALIGVFLVSAILRRTAQEDRVLREQLEGYAAYSRKVRYRLLPGVW